MQSNSIRKIALLQHINSRNIVKTLLNLAFHTSTSLTWNSLGKNVI